MPSPNNEDIQKALESAGYNASNNITNAARNFLNATAEIYISGEEAEVLKNAKNLSNSSLQTSYLNCIEGLPYQFLPNVDRRIEYSFSDNKNAKKDQTSSVGRKYYEKIVSRMPILFLMPCVAKFRETKENTLALAGTLANMANVSKESLTSFLLNQDVENSSYTGRYYETQFASYGYYQHLQTMLSTLASYMGIQDEKVYFQGELKSIKDISWFDEGGNLTKDFAAYFSGKESIAFYLDGFDSVTENFDNDTTKPSIASDFDNVSDEAREIRFLYGDNQKVAATILYGTNIASSILDNFSGGLLSTDAEGNTGFNLAGINVGGLASTMEKYFLSGIYQDLMLNSKQTIYQGGRILFPEIWSDSSYNKSYNLSIKLRSPDHDKVSIFMNLFVPYCKLLALTLPHAASDVLTESSADLSSQETYMDPNTYFSPYLIKAYSKGTINIDMGIIESLSVTKGGTGQWTVDGLPTQLDIELSIKDLYHALSMSGWAGGRNPISGIFHNLSSSWAVVSNSAYMDFLANMAGLNVKDTHMRKIGLMLNLAEMRFKNTGANLRAFASNYISNKVRNFYENW